MDRAGQLLRQLEAHALDASARVPAGRSHRGAAGLRLPARPGPGPSCSCCSARTWARTPRRPLLGKPTPCVGREQELALLELAFTTCVQELAAAGRAGDGPGGHGQVPAAPRVPPPPGAPGPRGRRCCWAAGPDERGLGPWAARPGRAAGCAASLDGEPLETRRAQLAQRLAPPPAARAGAGHAEFLGELCGIPFPDEDSPRLRAGPEDPQLMSTQVGRALVSFLRAECAHQPGAAGAGGSALGRCAHASGSWTRCCASWPSSPLMVLALARPEVKELFPGLWAAAAAGGAAPGAEPEGGRAAGAARCSARRCPTPSWRGSWSRPRATPCSWRS